MYWGDLAVLLLLWPNSILTHFYRTWPDIFEIFFKKFIFHFPAGLVSLSGMLSSFPELLFHTVVLGFYLTQWLRACLWPWLFPHWLRLWWLGLFLSLLFALSGMASFCSNAHSSQPGPPGGVLLCLLGMDRTGFNYHFQCPIRVLHKIIPYLNCKKKTRELLPPEYADWLFVTRALLCSTLLCNTLLYFALLCFTNYLYSE